MIFEHRVAQVIETLRAERAREAKRQAHYSATGHVGQAAMLSLGSFEYSDYEPTDFRKIIVRYWPGGHDGNDRESEEDHRLMAELWVAAVYDKRDEEWWCDAYMRLEVRNHYAFVYLPRIRDVNGWLKWSTRLERWVCSVDAPDGSEAFVEWSDKSIVSFGVRGTPCRRLTDQEAAGHEANIAKRFSAGK